MTIIKTAVHFVAFMIFWVAIVGIPAFIVTYFALREIMQIIIAS